MTSRARRATAAALAAAAAFVVPAAAHTPRDERTGAPRMDLEVLVTPAVTGEVSPGGADALVAIDRFGNRFAVARKEDHQTVVGVDQRADTVARSAAYHWVSLDDGLTWENLELFPRGAESLLPQSHTRDIAASGPRTWIGEARPGLLAVTTITATFRGRYSAGGVATVPLSSFGGRLSIAGGGSTVVLATGNVLGGTELRISRDAGVSFSAADQPVSGTLCDVAVDERRPSHVAVACLAGDDVALHTSRDAGKSFRTQRLGGRDTRGSDVAEPSVDAGPDGTFHVLSGLRMWSVPRDGAVRLQDLRSAPGQHRATTLAVSKLGRVGAAAYRRTPAGTWNVVVTVFTPGRAPVWSDFAFHDPAGPAGSEAPPSPRLSVDFDERNRIQLLWTSTFVQETTLQRPLLRNVWAVRSTST